MRDISFLNRNIHQDGNKVWLSTSGVPLVDEKGNLIGGRRTDRDITARLKSERELRIKEKAFTSSLNGILLTDLEGTILYANPAVLKMWGYDEVIGRALAEFLLKPKEAGKSIRHLQEKSEWRGELVARKQGETILAVLLSVSMVREENGEPICLMCSFVDITERKKAEEKLRKYRDHLEEMLEKRTSELMMLNQKNLREIEKRKKSEKRLRISRAELQEQAKVLEDKNIALREILHQLDIEKKKIQDDVMTNIQNLVLPVLNKIKMEATKSEEKLIHVLEYNLGELASSFGRKITEALVHLTPREIWVCDLIKIGLTSKEIARLLRISIKTVEKHRDTIRKKFKIRNKNINLFSFLQNL